LEFELELTPLEIALIIPLLGEGDVDIELADEAEGLETAGDDEVLA